MNKIIVTTAIFFLFLLLVTNNAQARIYDSETAISVTYSELFAGTPISGIITTSGIVSYGNTVEEVFENASGIYNVVLTETSGAWSRNIYSVSTDSIFATGTGIYNYPLIQNSTEIDLFYPSTDGTYKFIKQYRKIKGDTTWTYLRNATSVGDTNVIGDYDCAFGNDLITIYCHLTQGYSSNIYAINPNGTVTSISTSYLLLTRRLTSTNITNDIYVFGYLPSTYLGYIDISSIATNGRTRKDIYLVPDYYFSNGFSSWRKGYVFLNMLNYTFFGFNNNNTLGINCIATVGLDTKYFCNDTSINNGGFPFTPFTTYGYALTKGVSFTDTNANIHYIYFNGYDGRYINLGHEFQANADTDWYYHGIINSVDTQNVQGYGLTLYGTGTIFSLATGSQLYFYYENTSTTHVITPPTPPIPPIPPATADSSVMGMMCGAGSYFTGTDYSGGCQVASLFLLAIILSVMGWLFKYLKHEYGEEIPDKYLISGVISAFFIIGFMAIGMSDLLTGIMAVVLILTMIVSYSQSFGGGKK